MSGEPRVSAASPDSLGRGPKAGPGHAGLVSQATLAGCEPASRPSGWLGKPAAEMRAEEDALRDSQPLATSCLFCDWTFIGTAAEGRDKARAHRLQAHPEAVGRRTKRKHKGYRLDAYVDDDLIAEQRERRRLREETERLATIARGRQRAEAAA